MARKKVNLQWITKKTTRHAAYKRRVKTLMKKTSDLVSLCGIKATVVVYGEGETQPEVWPSVFEAKQIFNKFKDMPEHHRFKKMQNEEGFLISRISTLRGQICKLQRENQEYETLGLLHEIMEGRRPSLVGTTTEELNNLSLVMDAKMMKVKKRLQQLVGEGSFLKLQESPTLLPQAPHNYTEMQMLEESEEHHASQ